jgi:oligosaccharide repeat unit polymerase
VLGGLVTLVVLAGCAWIVVGAIEGQVEINSPLLAFMLSWSVSISLYFARIVSLDEVHQRTWWLISGSVVFTSMGYMAAIMPALSHGVQMDAVESATNRRATSEALRRLIRLCAWVGAPLALLYVRYIWLNYDLTDPRRLLAELRSGLEAGQVPLGFRFFYFAELLCPTAFVLAQTTTDRKRKTYVLLGIGALLLLLLTSGRANLIRALIWSAVALLLYRNRAPITWRRFSSAVAALVVVLTIFVFMGGFIGKTLGNSELRSQQYNKSVPASLVIPYLYLAGPIPALDDVLADPAVGRASGVTIRPVFQVSHALGLTDYVPAKVQTYRRIPYAFNLTTALGPIYQDGGSVGVMLFSFLQGAVVGFAFALCRQTRLATDRLIVGLLVVGLVSAPIDLYVNNLSVWIQLTLLLFARSWERRARRESSRHYEFQR